jgi:hypothetical protein
LIRFSTYWPHYAEDTPLRHYYAILFSFQDTPISAIAAAISPIFAIRFSASATPADYAAAISIFSFSYAG